ncbi:YcnI family copper-binding membrane protein [Pseudofrankia inefficax]|uniref:Nuclear export factor GLE1 n=1 Tax=Pseudofrankia inefficax (strain DSM 45817 / CECT 9037 / DDB 130130 / EuI1c) TaxID=298654 RepID=E3IYK2_PSEI1|nr:YcnI family protein [Pseudofrankia inefficax]ADP85073.1 nuclear export factor GLE1 [Pseudofrankia inefficax]
MSRKMPRFARVAGVTAIGAVAVVAMALPASAHVTVSPQSAPAGGYVQLSFNVPSESDTASTTKLDVQFPTADPIASVEVQPKAGWTYEVKSGAPSRPVTDDDGNKIVQVVNEITWTATGPGIKPGEFDTFVVSAGPLPTDAKSVSFKALQTYSDGSVVRWIDESQAGQPEPEHPAPTVTLTAAAEGTASTTGATTAPAAAPATATATAKADDTARGLGIAGLVVGVLGLVAAGLALASTRRRSHTGG